MLNDFPYKLRIVFLNFVAGVSKIKAEKKLTSAATASGTHVLSATYRELREHSRGPAMQYHHGNQDEFVMFSWVDDVDTVSIQKVLTALKKVYGALKVLLNILNEKQISTHSLPCVC